MPDEVRNDGPVLSLFEGGIRLSLHEGAVNIGFTMKDQGDQKVVANFALDIPNLVFLARSLMGYADMVQPLLAAPKVPGEDASKVIPLDTDGTCPECDAARGITASGDIRNCGSCNFTWRVK